MLVIVFKRLPPPPFTFIFQIFLNIDETPPPPFCFYEYLTANKLDSTIIIFKSRLWKYYPTLQ